MSGDASDPEIPASPPPVSEIARTIPAAPRADAAGAAPGSGERITPGGGRSELAFSAIVPIVDQDTLPNPHPPSYLTPSRRTPASAPPPPLTWGRYENLVRIGAGGMGTVYKAKDPRLNRYVALKFIRDNDPSLIQRFIWEARAQARVEHPHVCKVYEVDDIDGIPYIAMQYIDGEPLSSAAQKMPLEQRIRVVQQVAEGLHAAHKLGLIHRDIKPANILIERTSEGAYCPYLVDFGLAREIAADGRTIYGMEGTPAYMSPEQVAGDMSKLDRRTDVYALGATLYELLSGRPPFDEGGVLNILRLIANEPPKPLRSIDKALPADLEAIAMKCLEKEPQQRYESARALAEDLDRYLNGEPILARHVSWLYLALKRAKKHKLLVALSLVAFLLLVTASVVALRAKVAAARQAEKAEQVGALAQSLGQDVKEMELFMRYAYALPLHDTMREKQIIRTRMAKIEQRIEATRESLGNLAEGPGYYALGRGYLTLQEPERALVHLEQAWKGGYTAPEAALAVGQAHGMLYRQGMDKAQHLADKTAREAKQKDLADRHLAPALRYLRESAATETESSPYTAALIALYEKRFDDALKAAGLAFEQAPWLYEAKKLEGEIYFTRAAASHEQGRSEEAILDYKRAIESQRNAAKMATSDPTIYQAEAEAWLQVMVIEQPRGSSVQALFLSAEESCDHAILADPRQGSSYATKAWAHVQYGTRLLATGADPRPELKKAIEASQQAIEWDGPDAGAYNSIGTSHWLAAIYESGLALDTRPSLQSAIEHMEKALDLNPNSAWAWNDLGATYCMLGEYNASHGADPLPFFQLGAGSIDRAIDINPHYDVPYVNLGWLYAQQAQYELDQGQDPTDSLDHSINSLEGCLVNATVYQGCNNLGLAYLIKARHELATEQSADMSLLRALESFRVAMQANPEDVEALQGVTAVHSMTAISRMQRRVDPEDMLREGRKYIQGVIATNAQNASAHLALGQLDLLAGRWAIDQHRNPKKLFDSARSSFARALLLNRASSIPHRALAELHMRRAEWALVQGLPAGSDILSGLSAIDQSLAIDSTFPASIALQGALHLLQARAERVPSARKQLAGRAQAALEKALHTNPFLRRDYEPFLRQARKLLASVDG